MVKHALFSILDENVFFTLERVISLLEKESIDAVIVGGFAVQFQIAQSLVKEGKPNCIYDLHNQELLCDESNIRNTNDIDIIVKGPAEELVEKLKSVVRRAEIGNWMPAENVIIDIRLLRESEKKPILSVESYDNKRNEIITYPIMLNFTPTNPGMMYPLPSHLAGPLSEAFIRYKQVVSFAYYASSRLVSFPVLNPLALMIAKRVRNRFKDERDLHVLQYHLLRANRITKEDIRKCKEVTARLRKARGNGKSALKEAIALVRKGQKR